MRTRPGLIKRLIFAVVLVVFVGAGLLAVCETVIRVRQPAMAQPVGRESLSSEIVYDPVVGWKGMPGFESDERKDGVGIRINADGFRDEEWAHKLQTSREQDALRILCIGDSLTYGYRIPARHRVSEQLVVELAKHGRPAVVFNAGMPGFGTGQEFRTLEQLLPRLEPDVVLVWYCSNDIGDSALPYDFRLPQRAYKPFYDLEGNLVLHERVPLRFSQRVKGTWFESLQTRYMVDYLLYRLEDAKFDTYTHLWNNPAITDPPRLTAAQKARWIGSLGSLSVLPELKPWYNVNKRRNIALWRRMLARCDEAGARMLWICDSHVATESTTELMEAVREADGEVVDYGDPFDRVREWGGVWGDGHPNAVLNYVLAGSIADTLLDTPAAPADFTQADWITEVPTGIHFPRPHSRRILFGAWGRVSREGRVVGNQDALCMLRTPPGETGPWALQVTGRGVHDDDTETDTESPRLRLMLEQTPLGEFAFEGAGTVTVQAPLPSPPPDPLFLRLRADGVLIIETIAVVSAAETGS